MTEPDPIAALAAQLEELRGRLLRAEGATGQVRARLEESAGQDMLMLLEIKKLGEKIDAAIARRAGRRTPGAVLARAEQGGTRGPARRAPRLGRACRPGPVRRVLRQAAAVLAVAPGRGDRAQHRDGGVGPDLRRPGQQAPAGRPGVERQVASRRPRPPERRYQVRRLRLPPGAVVALGAIAPALLLTIPKAPACFPCAGSFRVRRDARY